MSTQEDNKNKEVLDYITEEIQIQLIFRNLGSLKKSAMQSGYDFSSLPNDILIKEIMTIYYIDALVAKEIISKETGDKLNLLFSELMKLNKIYSKFVYKKFYEQRINEKEYDDVKKLIKSIEAVFIKYGILNEEGTLDFEINIRKAIEKDINGKYQDNNKITSLSSSLNEDYQEIMKRVKTIPQN